MKINNNNKKNPKDSPKLCVNANKLLHPPTMALFPMKIR